jgi:uncharacterized radical SAM protein YgiQ
MTNTLPMTVSEMLALGWDKPDICLVTGDGFIDHPSFGAAIIARKLQKEGYRVAIIAQPSWRDCEEFKRFGRPRLAFFVTAGNLDSMVAHYTVNKHRRSEDAYTPGGRAGARPDRACIVYSNRIREAYGDVPIVLGGIEASLRRFAHYDYWDDKIRHSILTDAGADLLVYGMGEKPALEIAKRLSLGVPADGITDVRGTVFNAPSLEGLAAIEMPGFREVASDKGAYNRAFLLQQGENDAIGGRVIAQRQEKGYVVANPPPLPLSQAEMDEVYALPFARDAHPDYKKAIPALGEALFSLTSTRGCFGGCSFCALHFHQGRALQARSHVSLLAEARTMTEDSRFRGYIHDVGGPTANFRHPACRQQQKNGVCKDRACLSPPCKNLYVSHRDYLSLLRKLRSLPKVKKVFVRSGIRYDYVMLDREKGFLEELLVHHISGQLRVAPEHTSPTVLHLMGKPSGDEYERFCQSFSAIVKNNGLELYIVPYFISSHPGSDMNAAIALACEMKKTGQRPEQVQDFYPTPGTLSTAMYYTGVDPRDGKEVYVPRDPEEKRMQRALLQFFLPQNAALVRKALLKAEREDLIGNEGHCLFRPDGEGGAFIGRKRQGAAVGPRRQTETKGKSHRTQGTGAGAQKGAHKVEDEPKKGGRPAKPKPAAGKGRADGGIKTPKAGFDGRTSTKRAEKEPAGGRPARRGQGAGASGQKRGGKDRSW